MAYKKEVKNTLMVYETFKGNQIKISNNKLKEIGFVAGKKFNIIYNKREIILKLVDEEVIK